MKKLVSITALMILAGFSLQAQVKLNKPATNSTDIATTIALWAEYEGSSAYTYQVNISADSNFSTIDFEGTNNRYYVIATRLKLGTKYFWRMRRWKGTDTTSWSDTWNFKTSSVPTIQGPGDGGAYEEFTPIYLHRTNHYNYEVQLDTQKGFKSSALHTFYDIDTGKTEDLHWFYNGFFYNQKHYLRFRTFNTGDTSPWSTTIAFDIEFTLENTSVRNTEEASPALNWKRPYRTRTNAYEARLDTTANFNSSILIEKTFTELNRDVPLYMGPAHYSTTYYWSVRAMNAKDTSDWIQAPSTFNTGDHTFSWPAPSRFYPNQEVTIKLDTFVEKARVYYDTALTESNSPNLKYFEFNPTRIGGDNTLDTLKFENLLYAKTYFLTVQLFNGKDSVKSRNNSPKSVFQHSNMRDPYRFRKYGTRVELDFDTSYAMGSYFRVQVDSNSDFSSPFLDETYNSTSGFQGKKPRAELEFSKRYYWRVKNGHKLDTSLWSNRYILNYFETFSAPTLTGPSDGIRLNTLNFVLRWERVYNQWTTNKDTVYYQLQYDTSANFNSPELKNRYRFNDAETTDTAFCQLFNTKYYWRVRIFNTMDTSVWSEVRSFNTADKIYRIEPEEGDTNIMPSFIDWLSIEGTKGYVLYLDTVKDLSSKSNKWIIEKERPFFHSFFENNTRLDFNTKYFFKLGVFTPKDTLYSDTISFTTRKRNGVILTSPVNGANEQSWNTTLRWNTFPGSSTKQYLIEVSESPSMSDSQTYSSTGNNRPVNLSPAKTYYWRVRAMFNDVTATSDYSVIWKFSTKGGLDSPTLILPKDSAIINAAQHTFSWSSVADAAGYQFQIDQSPLFSGPRSLTTASTSINVNQLAHGQTYYWRVRASAGTIFSPWSEVRTFNVDLSAKVQSLKTEQVKVYPSPTSGLISVESKAGLIEKVEVFDGLGRLVFSQSEVPSSIQNFNISHLSNGLYHMVVTIENLKYPIHIQVMH